MQKTDSKDNAKQLREKLGKKIKAARAKSTIIRKTDNAVNTGVMRVGIELVSGVVAGSFIGYLIDYFADTLPVFLILCFILGAIGGFLNIYRLSKK